MEAFERTLPSRFIQARMGAEEEREAAINKNPTDPNPNPNRITQAQFLSWKRQKVVSIN